MSYTAPLKEFAYITHHVLDMKSLSQTEKFAESTLDIFDAVIEEAAKFSEQVVAPLNRTGDEEGARFEDGKVFTPAGFKEAYQQVWRVEHSEYPPSPDRR